MEHSFNFYLTLNNIIEPASLHPLTPKPYKEQAVTKNPKFKLSLLKLMDELFFNKFKEGGKLDLDKL